MRIIAGIAGGRRLSTLSGRQTRPTADRVKEAIFSVVAPFVEDSRVLDAFAGSAALGLEALSRGAASALFVEKDHAAAEVCAANIAALGLGGELLRGDVLKLLPRLKQSRPELAFDIVFADPPYGAGLLNKLLEIIAQSGLLAEDGLVVAETSSKERDYMPPQPYQVVKRSVYGDTAVHYCRISGR